MRSVALLLGLSIALGAAAQDIFLCTDDQGRKFYQNTGNSPNCKRLEVQPILTPPASAGGQHRLPPEPKAPTRPANPPSDDKGRQDGTGTAFFVNADGLAVTNWHVVKRCSRIQLAGRNDTVNVVASDPNNDLALLRVAKGNRSAARIIRDPRGIRQGEEVVVYGFPLFGLLSQAGNVTPGVVSALSGLANNTAQMQITAAVQAGSSGSAVLNRRGEVIGVVMGSLSDEMMFRATGTLPQNVNFAVSGAMLRAFLDANKVKYLELESTSAPGLETADLAEQARSWTALVYCRRR